MQAPHKSLVNRIVWIGSVLGLAISLPAQDIPTRPEEISFRELAFDPPKAGSFRHELPGGVGVYLAPSHEFPLVDLAFTFKGGSYLDPADMVGLAEATATMIRRGGTIDIPAEELDEKFDFLAARAGVGAGDFTVTASLNTLESNLEESFKLFMDMLRNPRFQEDRFELFKEESLEAMKQRNDDAGSILAREWDALLYGREHYRGRVSNVTTLNALTIEKLRQFHSQVYHPGNLTVAVSGDFEPKEMLARLEQAFAGWERGMIAPDPSPPTAILEPGVYHVAKEIPQGKVQIGLRTLKRDDPDYFPMVLMNQILGGGGFTSRITKRVRSQEGLAYSAYSRFRPEVWYPGEFEAGVQSKNRTVALAIKIILEEVERIKSTSVSDEEIVTAKNSFIERFPRRFESKSQTLDTFVDDELTRRPDGYWDEYRDNIRKVTKEDLQRVANKYLRADHMAIMVVGDWEEIAPGDLEGRANMAEFFDGQVKHLPLRDPLTQEPLPDPN